MSREELRAKAQAWYKYCAERYRDDIEYSVIHSSAHREEDFSIPVDESESVPPIEIVKMTTSDAIENFYEDNKIMAVLNFASYKHPGGGFIKGSWAQEEALCHESFLYNVIGDEKFEDEYNENNKNHFLGLYSNWAIYSPMVYFSLESAEYPVDVITCPSPNLGKYVSNSAANINMQEYNKVYRSRCKYVLDLAETKHVDTLIIGAFGCGVFKNDVKNLAQKFCTLLREGDYHFSKVIFAIPDSKNFNAFSETANSIDFMYEVLNSKV